MEIPKTNQRRKKTKESPSKQRPQGMVMDIHNSEFSDLESSSSNSVGSTLKFNSGIRKSHSSVDGLKVISTQEQALATLDDFLADVDEAVEKAKEDEKQKLSHVPKAESSKPRLIRRSSSFPNIAKEVFHSPSTNQGAIPAKSTTHLNPDDSVEGKFKLTNKGKSHSVKPIVGQPGEPGLQHLNQLYKLVEHLESLQNKSTPESDNSSAEKNEDVINSEPVKIKVHPPKHEKIHRINNNKKPTKVKPKKSSGKHKNRFEAGRFKYSALLGRKFLQNAKSVENIKMEASKDRPVIETKPQGSPNKQQIPYALDDLEVGKNVSNNYWNAKGVNDSIIVPTNSPPLARANATEDLSFDPQSEPDIHAAEKDNKEIEYPTIIQSPINLEKFLFPDSEIKYEENVLTNHSMLDTTEWSALQKSFPQPPVQSSEDLWHHFISHRNNHKKKSSPNKRRRSWFIPKTDKKRGSNMFLPNIDLGGFNVNLLAAQSLSDQMTLSLDLTTLENTLSSHSSDAGSILSPSDYTFNESLQVI